MHITPFLTSQGTEPFTAILTVIDSSKDLAERVHAGLGVVDYGSLIVLDPAPSEHPVIAAGKADYKAMGHAELCGAIKDATADPSKMPWGQIIQMVLALLQQLLPA